MYLFSMCHPCSSVVLLSVRSSTTYAMPRRDKNVRASAAKRQRLSAIAPDDFEDLDEAASLEVPPPQGLPPGPSTADELQQWPLDLVRRLVGYNNGALKPLLEKSASYGSRNITDYSGFDCPREMTYQITRAMQHEALQFRPQNFVRACDNAKGPLDVLAWTSHHLDNSCSCLLTDIQGCLSDEEMKTLDDMIPHKSSKKMTEDEASENSTAYSAMLDYLMTNRQRIFPDPLESECRIHGGCCAIDASRGRVYFDDALEVDWAGTTCTGWSSVGTQARFAHMSERTHCVWLVQRVVLAEAGKESCFFQAFVSLLTSCRVQILCFQHRVVSNFADRNVRGTIRS